MTMEEKVKNIIDAYESYIKTLSDEINDLASIARMRGFWNSKRVDEAYEKAHKIQLAKIDYTVSLKEPYSKKDMNIAFKAGNAHMVMSFEKWLEHYFPKEKERRGLTNG